MVGEYRYMTFKVQYNLKVSLAYTNCALMGFHTFFFNFILGTKIMLIFFITFVRDCMASHPRILRSSYTLLREPQFSLIFVQHSQDLSPVRPPVLFRTLVVCYAYSHVLECTVFVLCVENLLFVFYFILV
jgi:hypothetical protein